MLIVNVALPADNVPVPRVTVPSRNVTVPDGLLAPGATTVTVAVKVTDWPKTDGFTEDATLTVLLSLLTV